MPFKKLEALFDELMDFESLDKEDRKVVDTLFFQYNSVGNLTIDEANDLIAIHKRVFAIPF
jgi:hypothetical protein